MKFRWRKTQFRVKSQLRPNAYSNALAIVVLRYYDFSGVKLFYQKLRSVEKSKKTLLNIFCLELHEESLAYNLFGNFEVYLNINIKLYQRFYFIFLENLIFLKAIIDCIYAFFGIGPYCKGSRCIGYTSHMLTFLIPKYIKYKFGSRW